MTDPTLPPATPSSFDFNRPTLVALLYLAAAVTGFSALIGIVLAYVWRSEPYEPWEGTHYTYHIRTFWIALAASFLCVLLSIVLIGFLGFVALGIWMIVRTVMALIKAQKREAIADPQTLLW